MHTKAKVHCVGCAADYQESLNQSSNSSQIQQDCEIRANNSMEGQDVDSHSFPQSDHQPSAPATLFERRHRKGRISPVRLDCIRPFTSKSDSICVLSAPATHIRLQTVPCGDGFVVHRCIDIRTHEFFLHPERMVTNQISDLAAAPTLNDCIADAAASIAAGGSALSATPSCMEPPESSPLLSSDFLSSFGSSSNPCSGPCSSGGDSAADAADAAAVARADTPTRCARASPTHPATPASDCASRRRPPTPPLAAPRPSSSPARRPPSPPLSGGGGHHRPPGGGGGKRKVTACTGEGSAPGTPCNVEAIAWLVGAAAAVAASAAAAASPRPDAAPARPPPSPSGGGGEGGVGGAERHARPPLGGAASGGGAADAGGEDGAARRKRARHGYAG
jgi:hypothetical protein